jgi:thymidylate synthase
MNNSARIIRLENMSQYPAVVHRVQTAGKCRAPRGQQTYDLGFTVIELVNTEHALPLGVGRKLSTRIAAVEAAQLIAGVSTPQLVLDIAPQFSKYANEDTDGKPTFHGAYGQRIGFQVLVQVEKLKKDPNTRQAVITLWDPWLDNLPSKFDYPCTNLIQLSIHDGRLEMNVVMRSNDVWLGLPYDIFQFTQLQRTIARALGCRVELYRHTAMSLHLYEENVTKASALWQQYTNENVGMRRAWGKIEQPDGIGKPGDTYSDIMNRAEWILEGKELEDETRSERWYRHQLHGATEIAPQLG